MLKSAEPFAFGGLWETWKDKGNPNGEPIHSCSIITTVPNALIAPIHYRMPAILPEELYKDWIGPTNDDTGLLRELLSPYDPGLMKAYQVSTLVNSPKNYGPELIAPEES